MFNFIIIVVEFISVLGVFASIFWLFKSPGFGPLITSFSFLSALIITSFQARIKILKIQDESLLQRLRVIQEFKHISDNIPNISLEELIKKLNSDKHLLESLTGRLVTTVSFK